MYGSLTAWRAHATDRGDSAPTDALDADATAALVRASDHVQYTYVVNFAPPYDDTVAEVALATYDAANYELATPGFFSATYTPDQQKVLSEVKGIKWTLKDANGDIERDPASPVSTDVEKKLRRYMQRKNRVSIGTLGS